MPGKGEYSVEAHKKEALPGKAYEAHICKDAGRELAFILGTTLQELEGKRRENVQHLNQMHKKHQRS